MLDFSWLIDSVYAHYIKIPLIWISVLFGVLMIIVAVLVYKALKKEDFYDD